MKTKKSNSYLKMGLIIFAACVGGGILGGIMGGINRMYGNGMVRQVTGIVTALQVFMVPLLTAVLAAAVILGEYTLYETRLIGKKMQEADDEEYDRLAYEEEKMTGLGTDINVASMAASIIILTAGYSMKYIESDRSSGFLAACLVFIVCYVYAGYWQIRLVKLVQKLHPEKKGDPVSRKFRKQWLASCDEAEKEVVFQSAYTAYIALTHLLPILILIAMLGNLFYQTGMLAVILLAVIWIYITIIYTSSCTKMRRVKAEKR